MRSLIVGISTSLIITGCINKASTGDFSSSTLNGLPGAQATMPTGGEASATIPVGPSSPQAPVPKPESVLKGDFNGDGHADILWQNANGNADIWYMDGTALVLGGIVTDASQDANPGPGWKVIGSGDFDGDGHLDILWQNANGEALIWFMNGTAKIGGGFITAQNSLVTLSLGSGWNIVGIGDFNGDGRPDILWEGANGEVVIWYMNGASQIGGGSVTLSNSSAPLVAGPDWNIVGTGDFDGDGHLDILWQNVSGEPAIWNMNGTAKIGGGSLVDSDSSTALNPGTTWKIVGVGDFNGDGYPDILWQNTAGNASIWYMKGLTTIGGGPITLQSQSTALNPGADWKILGTGDFDGDGHLDIVLQNTNGQPAVWLMNGTKILNYGNVTNQQGAVNPGAAWQVIN